MGLGFAKFSGYSLRIQIEGPLNEDPTQVSDDMLGLA